MIFLPEIEVAGVHSLPRLIRKLASPTTILDLLLLRIHRISLHAQREPLVFAAAQ